MSASLTAITTAPRGRQRRKGADARDDQTPFPRDLDDQHERLVHWFEEAERVSWEARERSERDRDYYNGIQWTVAEREALRKRGQPEITINYISRKVQLMCGLERKARTDPKAFPRTPQEDDRADAATQALRFIADDNSFTTVRSDVFENLLVEGYGGVEIGLADDGRGGADITLTRIGWERLWHDPHSRQADFLDARYLGMVVWMDRDQCEEMYPGHEDIIESSFAGGLLHYGTYNDRPDFVAWTDNQRQRTRVVQCWWTEGGTWWGSTYTRAGFLADPQKSKFRDRKGKSACPLILQSAYVDRENRRYGMVRDLISLQDELNKRRSKALHLLSVNRVIAEQGAVTDVDHARREVARPDGYVEVMPGMRFDVEAGAELAAGQFQLLQHATQEMQLSGPNASMAGTDPRELSGRAILAQQAGGAVQNEPLADSLRMWSRRVYETAWMAVREFWSAGKWVRVTDDLNETRWVGINTPVTLQDELASMPDDRRAQAMQHLQITPGDPRLQQVIRTENDITDLDVDIVIEEGQTLPTLEAENFQTLIQLAGMQPGLIPGDVLIAASSLRNKADLLARMKAHMQQQAQQQAAQAPLQQAHAQAVVAKLQGDAAASDALAKERQVNAVRGIHDIHSDFSAPPYGQPNVAPDVPSMGDGSGMVNAADQLTPEMAQAHQLADLRGKHAAAALNEAKVAHTAQQAVHTAVQAAHEPHKVAATIAGTHNTFVTTQRLAQTPIPQPQPPAQGAQK